MATIEDATPAARPVHEVLAANRELITPALRSATDTLPDSMRRIAGYHFGWWDEHGRPLGADTGKAIRPSLVLLSAEAVGAPPETAVPAAVAVELVHNFSLLHDDVMDGDLTRRHRPTAWSVFGANPAILAGDALLTLAMDTLATCGDQAARQGARMLTAVVQELLDGQSMDLAFESRAAVAPAECLRMCRSKTGALLGCACALGASFGGADSDRVQHLRTFGECVGLAFQHVDDLLGIWGDPATTGKPVHSDLRSRKKTLPIAAALYSGTEAGRDLATLYTREARLTEEELARAADLIDAAGGRAWSQEQSTELLEEGLRSLAEVRPDPRAGAELAELARLAVRRDH